MISIFYNAIKLNSPYRHTFFNIKMAYRNPHCDFIDKRIADLRKSKKWSTKITQTSHEDFIKDFGANVFTNFVRNTFTAPYLKKHPCSDCNKPSKERCHGIGEDRPLLIRRALEKVYPDPSMVVTLKDVLIQFLEEHKPTKFTFKCSECHRKETNCETYVSV
jgi:hypothetical protein